MGKPQPVYVDRAKTRTAADITTISECDALLRRAQRDVEEIRSSGKQSMSVDTALHYAKMRMRTLQKRKDQLLNK